MHEVKTFALYDEEFIDSGTNVYVNFLTGGWTITTNWEMNYDNINYSHANGVGDSPITPTNMAVDGDVIITLGWADGFSIKRLENDGTFTNLHTDTGPNGYSGGTNLAIDTVTKKAITGWYGGTVIELYDYSDTGSISSVTKDGTDGLTAVNAGYSYINGHAIAGEWLYLADDDSTSVVRRWNFVTETADDLTVANIDKNGYRGWCHYIPDRDWIVQSWTYDGEIWLVQSASSDANATAHCINTEGISWGEDMDTMCCVADNDEHYQIWLSGYHGRIAKLDVGPILTGSGADPIVVERHPVYYAITGLEQPWWFTGYTHILPHPVSGSDMMIIYPYAGTSFPGVGWYDQENYQPVGVGNRYMGAWWPASKNAAKTMGYSPAASTKLGYDYGGRALPVTTANGTKYWVSTGYSGNGHSHRSWLATTAEFVLCAQSDITYGDFQLDNGGNIGSVQLTNFSQSLFVPTECSVDIDVSNDGGTSWENYNWQSNDLHVFSSTGDTVQFKMTLDGTQIKAPYFFNLEPPTIMIREKDFYERSNFIGRTRNKIKGI